MPPDGSLPASFMTLLSPFQVCLAAPIFQTFTALVIGFIAQTGPHTVTGMLLGAGDLTRRWHHSQVHRFFSQARWSADDVGLALAEAVIPRPG
jgi:hypothetical protein